MDFDPDPKQSDRLERLRSLVARHAPKGERLRYSEVLDGALRSEPPLVGPELELLDRVLLVEEAARLAAPFGATATLLLEPFMGVERPSGAMGVREQDPDAPVRDGAYATSLVVLEEGGARFGLVRETGVAPLESGLGDGYATVSVDATAALEWSLDLAVLEAYRLGLVAEIAGASRAALELTGGYLSERRQFGQPLAEFQALRHRLSERAVDVEATSVLARYAADRAEPTSVASAVCYATGAAAALVPELHQLCGARGFLHEFGLATFTMRIEALRVELGGVRRASIGHADAAWK